MSLDAHYKELMARANETLNGLVEDGERFQAFTAVHNYGAEFETLISAVKERPEAIVFNLALKEFYFSLYASANGSYRHAHIGLRLSFELFCAGVFFSAYEIKLRSWLAGLEGSDINWAAISSSETGIFSTNFLKAFNPDISPSGKQYHAIATKAYRECSEFVHGNVHTHELDSKPLGYRSEILEAWIERAGAVRLCVIFSFAGRYLRLLDKGAQAKVEQIMLDNFGHHAAIQAIYS